MDQIGVYYNVIIILWVHLYWKQNRRKHTALMRTSYVTVHSYVYFLEWQVYYSKSRPVLQCLVGEGHAWYWKRHRYLKVLAAIHLIGAESYIMCWHLSCSFLVFSVTQRSRCDVYTWQYLSLSHPHPPYTCSMTQNGYALFVIAVVFIPRQNIHCKKHKVCPFDRR